MTGELGKIDILRERLGISYREAKEALDAAGGDLVQALIDFEEKGCNFGERFQARGQEVMGQLKGLLQKGQDYRVKVKKGDETVFEFPASLGALGIVGALASSEIAVLGALGTAAAMAKKYTLEFERRVDPVEKAPDTKIDESDI